MSHQASTPGKMRLAALLFEKFELLDVFGPLELFGMVPDRFELVTVAQKAGSVKSNQGPAAVAQYSFDNCPHIDMLLVPGGMGTRTEYANPQLLQWIIEQRTRNPQLILMSVCTGAALLGAAGLLSNRRATSNKMSFKWVVQVTKDQGIEWLPEARWVEADDGQLWTSSGVSAGMDMAVAIIKKMCGSEVSRKVCIRAEYEPHTDSTWDPFGRIHLSADKEAAARSKL